MPRKPRQFEIGGIYHVVNRGVEKRDIFIKPQDYHRFIFGLEFCNSQEPTNIWSLVGSDPAKSLAGSDPAKLSIKLKEHREKKRKSIVEVLAFTLMPNHIHLILRETIKGGISLYMQKLGGYSTYFNKQYNRAGPLFQSRFKDFKIKDNIQLHAVFAYVHSNPIELWEPGWKDFQVKNSGQAIKKLNEYRFSSYNDYAGYARFPLVIQKNFFINFFKDSKECRRAVENWVYYKAQQTGITSEMLD